MPEAVATKPCTVCGIDCSKRARVKDQQGRYMCQECFDKVKQTKQVQKSPPPAAPAPVKSTDHEANANDNSFLLDIGGSKSATSTGTKVCPECGRGMSTNAVVCIGCGFNSQTGKRLSLKVEKAKKQSVGGDAAQFGGAMIGALIGGVVGGGIGAGIWMAVAHFANLEVGYVAWAVGGLTGAGCAMGARDSAGNTTGLMASGISLLAVGIGKYAAASMVVQNVDFATLLGPFDALWAILAVATAWRVGSMSIND